MFSADVNDRVVNDWRQVPCFLRFVECPVEFDSDRRHFSVNQFCPALRLRYPAVGSRVFEATRLG
jgi:hypothetical protein